MKPLVLMLVSELTQGSSQTGLVDDSPVTEKKNGHYLNAKLHFFEFTLIFYSSKYSGHPRIELV